MRRAPGGLEGRTVRGVFFLCHGALLEVERWVETIVGFVLQYQHAEHPTKDLAFLVFPGDVEISRDTGSIGHNNLADHTMLSSTG